MNNATATPGSKRLVLVAIDGSENSSRAFQWYQLNIWRPDDEVIIFHSVQPPNLPTISFSNPIHVPTEEWTTILKARIEAVNKLCDEYTYRAAQAHMKITFHTDNNAHAGDAIVNMAREKDVALIVLGCRGLSKLGRAFLGSVSDYVLHNSGRPVTIVPKEC